MSLLNIYSPKPFMVTEQADVRRFFSQLKRGHKPAFDRYQVAVVHGSSANWFVAVLVLTDAIGDDSQWIVESSKRWMEACGARVDDFESMTLRGESIESSLDHRYTILASFGTLGRSCDDGGWKDEDEDDESFHDERAVGRDEWAAAAGAAAGKAIGDGFDKYARSLPLWLSVSLGTAIFFLSGGLTCYIFAKCGLAFWWLLLAVCLSLGPAVIALLGLMFAAEALRVKRDNDSMATYTFGVFSVAACAFSVWLVSAGFTWWVLLPASLAVVSGGAAIFNGLAQTG